MSTAEELRAQILASQQQLQRSAVDVQNLTRERDAAEERQKLRRDLEDVRRQVSEQSRLKNWIRHSCQAIDRDEMGTHMPHVSKTTQFDNDALLSKGKVDKKSAMDCDLAVATGELEWSIKGFSWLRQALQQNEDDRAGSHTVIVGGHEFHLIYHPDGNEAGDHNQRASLSIFHVEPSNYTGVTFRYTIWVKSRHRGFVQWGERGSVCTDEDTDGMLFGPDVCKNTETPDGVFGLSHDQLVTSEWVIDDVFTAKIKLEVRPKVDFSEEEKTIAAIEVPNSKLGNEFLNLLDKGVCGDVSIVIQGEAISAHSVVLAARSEVFQRQFSCGLQESTSREVVIDDCEPSIFKAFVRFLYSDSFEPLEACLAELAATQASISVSYPSSGGSDAVGGAAPHCTKMPMLQQWLALSHKYQLMRLQLWCERQLCDYISIQDVCSVLCQSHLYECKQLEERCLEFIKTHIHDVVNSEDFVALSRDWPQVALKITMHIAGIPKDSVVAALEKHENVRKRKREE